MMAREQQTNDLLSFIFLKVEWEMKDEERDGRRERERENETS